MSSRSPLTVTFRDKDYAGEYEIDGSLAWIIHKDSSQKRKDALKG